jgi:hypothetical protein
MLEGEALRRNVRCLSAQATIPRQQTLCTKEVAVEALETPLRVVAAVVWYG